MLFCKTYIHIGCQLWREIYAKIILLAICPAMRLPFLCSFVKCYSFKAASPIKMLGLVSHVFRWCRESKIINSVVAFYPISMVNQKAIWHFTINIKPSKAMLSVDAFINFYLPIPVIIKRASDFPNKSFLRRLFSPSKNSSGIFVVKSLNKSFMCDVRGLHKTPFIIRLALLNNTSRTVMNRLFAR